MFYTIDNKVVSDFFDDLNAIFDDSESIRRMNRNLIDVLVNDDTLTIEGKSNSGNPNGFIQHFTICDKHDSKNIDASVIDGILTVVVPYKAESINRKIKVKVK